MRVARVGLTPVKGGRHRTLDRVALDADGPVGDRAFCLVDPVADRCVRTVEEPSLLQTSATWDGDVLAVELPSGRLAGEPVPGGRRTVDYWGRRAEVEVVDGPWAAAYSAHLGRDVVLARCPPGAVVYGGPVTLVTRASLDRLADEVGAPVVGTRFRPTLEVDGELAPFEEEGWLGRRLRVGSAGIRVRRVVTRCAVVDHHPDTGVRDLGLLQALARVRGDGALDLGLDCVITDPGHVAAGDPVGLTD